MANYDFSVGCNFESSAVLLRNFAEFIGRDLRVPFFGAYTVFKEFATLTFASDKLIVKSVVAQ